MKRRNFLAASGLVAGFGLRSLPSKAADVGKTGRNDLPLIVSTWPFGKAANERSLEVLKNGGGLLDAVERGINVVEDDVRNTSVGLSGIPNASGVVQLDACIMDGPTHKAGSVAALEEIANPISVARRIMERTKHVMLVGPGALEFALKEGFKRAAQRSGSNRTTPSENNHDTIALLALGADGNIAGGCSTSGLGGKLPGRVGDSPIIGSGLYVDNEVGAAGATGVGENVMRFCGSFLVVELMRQGLNPTEACIEAIKRIQKKHPPGTELSVNFVALNRNGEFGAAGTDKTFQFSATSKSFSKVTRATLV